LSNGEKHYLKAIELKPGYATTHHWYGMLLAIRGDFNEAVSELKTACRIDPLSPIVNADLAWVLYNARRYDEAIAQCRTTIELEPNFSVSYWNLGQSLREKGMLAEAVAAFEKADQLSDGNQVFRAALAHALALSGEKNRASEILEEFTNNLTTQYIAPHAMVMIYIGLCDYEQALNWFERAYEERSDFIIEASVNPAVDPLRDNARFKNLMRQLKF
jgi:Flp pilus assembly protein TadD